MRPNRNIDILNRKNETPVREHLNFVAVRIFYAENGFTPMAECVAMGGYRKTIRWDREDERNLVTPYIDAYTLFYDERGKRPFNEW